MCLCNFLLRMISASVIFSLVKPRERKQDKQLAARSDRNKLQSLLIICHISHAPISVSSAQKTHDPSLQKLGNELSALFLPVN